MLSVVASTSFAGGVAGAAGPTVQVGDADIEVGGTETVTLVLSNAPNGVSGFDLNVSVADGSTARISNLTVDTFSAPRTTISDGGREGFAQGIDLDREHEPGASDVRLVEVTLEGVSNGRTTLQIDQANIDNGDGNDIAPALESSNIVVGDPGAATDSTITPSETESGDNGGQGQQTGDASAEWSTTNVSDGATISVRELPSTATLDADLSGTAQGSGLSLQRLAIDSTFTIEDSFRVEVGIPTDAPGEAEAYTGGTALGYFTMEAIGVDSEQLDTVTAEIQVDQGELPDGASLESARLYRYHDGEWQPLQTSVSGDSTLEADTPGFSTFAVVVPEEGAATPTPEAGTTPGDGSSTATDGTSTDDSPAGPTEREGGGDVGFILGGVAVTLIVLVVGGGLFLSTRD